MKKNDRQNWETNLHMKRRARLGKYWCLGCDMYLVSSGEKCKECRLSEKSLDKKKDVRFRSNIMELIIEIHAGEGGQDAKLFIYDLAKAYVKYANS